jgi:hypothetical protein
VLCSTKGGSWYNFPEQILPSLVDAFKDEKSSVVVVLLVDFLSMTLVNLKKKKRSVAWIDGAGKWRSFLLHSLMRKPVNQQNWLWILLKEAQG